MISKWFKSNKNKYLPPGALHAADAKRRPGIRDGKQYAPATDADIKIALLTLHKQGMIYYAYGIYENQPNRLVPGQRDYVLSPKPDNHQIRSDIKALADELADDPEFQSGDYTFRFHVNTNTKRAPHYELYTVVLHKDDNGHVKLAKSKNNKWDPLRYGQKNGYECADLCTAEMLRQQGHDNALTRAGSQNNPGKVRKEFSKLVLVDHQVNKVNKPVQNGNIFSSSDQSQQQRVVENSTTSAMINKFDVKGLNHAITEACELTLEYAKNNKHIKDNKVFSDFFDKQFDNIRQEFLNADENVAAYEQQYSANIQCKL
ncbi:MAG: hypothetical protein GY821_07780 [Gammaproteobacteria bacterium]|nr:hypothetical protein [Gammaproteobacteria bacterium]